MNNTLALILTIVLTNWVSIGEFTDKAGAKFDVQQGQLQTNTVVDVYWNERLITPTPNRISNRVFLSTNRFILKSEHGPLVGERKLPTVWVRPIYATNIIWTLTNTPVDLRTSVDAILKTNSLESAMAHGYGAELDKLVWDIRTGKTNMWITNRTHILTNGIIMSLEELK